MTNFGSWYKTVHQKLSQRVQDRLSDQAGFTMIELLVVIAVIGVLAVAVLSSINPIEQINKGRDTRTRSDAGQLINAVDRYFATLEIYPWNRTTATYTSAIADDPDAEFVFTGSGDDWDWVDELVTTAEVKEGFTNRLKSDDTIIVFKEAQSNATMYACFVPTSQAFKREAADNCDNGVTAGSPTGPSAPAGITTCVSDPAVLTEDNYICLP